MEAVTGLPDWISAVIQVGFPIVVCAWLLFRMEAKMEAWTKSMNELAKCVELLSLRVQFIAADNTPTVNNPTPNRYVP